VCLHCAVALFEGGILASFDLSETSLTGLFRLASPRVWKVRN
jgi:hypothetical protein